MKRAETSADANDIHFQAILVTMIDANQFFLPPEHFAKIPLGFSCHWGSHICNIRGSELDILYV